MSWYRKYWDAIDQLYWDPGLLGLGSIGAKKQVKKDGVILVPSDFVKNGGSIYARNGTAAFNAERMRRLEEPLNHIFDIMFGIAPNSVVRRLLASPLGIEDDGPFLRLGREIAERYSILKGGTTTQQDGYFVSATSLIGVELKLMSSTNPGQVLKYAALMASEQQLTGKRERLGLLFITPNVDGESTFKNGALNPDGSVPADFFARVPAKEKNGQIDKFLEAAGDEVEAVLDRIRISHLSWAHLRDNVRRIAAEQDQNDAGGETLARLMDGFADAIEAQTGCITAS